MQSAARQPLPVSSRSSRPSSRERDVSVQRDPRPPTPSAPDSAHGPKKGSGAFQNDPAQTAADFRLALDGEFRGAFREVVFAIADWSPERRFLAPFRDAFVDG